MELLTSPKVLKALLNRHGFAFTKKLGQNFLIDESILEMIVVGAGITQEDCVLEIGPGVGTLTQALSKRAGKVLSVEIDVGLLSILDETLKDYHNVEIVHGDILKLNLRQLTDTAFEGKVYKMVANLPYYITTPIIMRFLEEDQPFSTLVVMVQKEVADRMAAVPGNKDYGSLSIAVQYYTSPRVIGTVPSTVFIPVPKVDSVVIALDKRSQPAVSVKDPKFFFTIVKAAFAQRRKTLLNTLWASGLYAGSKEELRESLVRLGIDPIRRGETLSLQEYASISDNF